MAGESTTWRLISIRCITRLRVNRGSGPRLLDLLIKLYLPNVVSICRVSLADGCPPLNQPCMFTMVSIIIYVLDLTIKNNSCNSSKREKWIQCCFNVGPAPHTVIQHSTNRETIKSMC